MCRSIKVLRKPDQPATPEEIRAAALQFVRKISGYHHPSQANQEVFDHAVTEIATASQHLLASLARPASRSAGRSGPRGRGAAPNARIAGQEAHAAETAVEGAIDPG
jgi:hypothetical protein